jgi:hypothetical protein
VEGASVREHDGHYYCLYSGGAWREPNYGVSYVVADHPMGPFAAEADAEGPGVLRTLPGSVIGPGHASVASAPDNANEYLVYHAWDPGHTARQMRIDPLIWDGGRPASSGPSLEPMPAPPLPTFRDNFDGPNGAPPDPDSWRVGGGDWHQKDGELVQNDPGARSATAQIVGVEPLTGYVFEANARLRVAGDEHGRYGVFIEHAPNDRTLLTLASDGSGLQCDWEAGGIVRRSIRLTLNPAVGADAYHQLLMSVRSGELEVRVDGVRAAHGIEAPPSASAFGLITEGTSAAFDGVSLSPYAGELPEGAGRRARLVRRRGGERMVDDGLLFGEE